MKFSWKIGVFALLTLLAFVFHRPLVEGLFGFGARILIRWEADCRFAYRSIAWKKGHFTFSDIVMIDAKKGKSAFHLHAKEVRISFDWSHFPRQLKGHVHVHSPYVAILDQREWGKGSKWLALSIDVEQGILDWPGEVRSRFTYVKSAPDHLGRFFLESDSGSSLSLEGVEEGKDIRLDGEFSQLNGRLIAKFLAFYVPTLSRDWEMKEGRLSGSMHLFLSEGIPKLGSCSFQMDQLGIRIGQIVLEQMDGNFDWDGPFLGQNSLNILNGLSCDARFRGELQHVNCRFGDAGLNNLQGNFSYNPGMGAKWDFNAHAFANGTDPIALSWKGHGFFHSQLENWIKTDLSLGEMRFAADGREKEGKTIWTAHTERFSETSAALCKILAAYYLPEISDWTLKKGDLEADGVLTFSESLLESWAFSKIAFNDLDLTSERLQISCQKLEGHLSGLGGEVALSEGGFEFSLANGRTVRGKDWFTQATWVDGFLAPAHLSGWIDNAQTAMEISGSLENWRAKGEIGGTISGMFVLSGGWEKDLLSIAIEKAEVEGISFAGEGWVDANHRFFFEMPTFQGKVDSFSQFFDGIAIGGQITSSEEGVLISGTRDAWDWSIHANITNGTVLTDTFPPLEDIKMELYAGTREISCYGIEGGCVTPQGKVPFECLCIRKVDARWEFDACLKTAVWDLLRIAGESDGKIVCFNSKSHLLGIPLQEIDCEVEGGRFKQFEAQATIPWSNILAAGPFLKNFGIKIPYDQPLSGSGDFHFRYSAESGAIIGIQGVDLKWKEAPLLLDFYARGQEGKWTIDRCQVGSCSLACQLERGAKELRIGHGKALWKDAFETDFEGKIGEGCRVDLSLGSVSIDLSQVSLFSQKFGLSLEGLKGFLHGSGHFQFQSGESFSLQEGVLQIDLDATASHLAMGPFTFENNGPIHLLFSSDKGIMFRGIDLQAFKNPAPDPWVACKVDLLEFDARGSHWALNHSQIHLSKEFLNAIPNCPPILKSANQELDFIADIDCAHDFSSISCSMHEGIFPLQGTAYHIQDLNLKWTKSLGTVDFHYLHRGHLIKAAILAEFEPMLTGKLSLQDEEHPEEMPLTLYWQYGDELSLQAIEGTFGGIEASFHLDSPNILIGSARVHFGLLSELIPPMVGDVFRELEMGKGYEIKGRLQLFPDGPRFSGLLSGKQVELFGFQLRTLLAKIELGPEEVHITNLKISDTAGILKAEEIRIGGKGDEPWTISIPRVLIQELRPSLLHNVGEEVGEISPLVVRELTLNNFKGLVSLGKSWTADGNLHFINSYKRAYTLFDLPADVLSRIVGLDLELLIPVRGALSFELKEGFFWLLDLKDSFSEASRSEFFLAKEDLAPTMDLDGNLKILVKMKQFILFKFTEAFLISIEGTLNDPKFHLQKKKRFLGI